MKLKIENGFLVETFPSGRHVQRRARIVEERPAGRVELDSTVTLDGQRYAVAYHFVPGFRQGRAVAWPKGRS